MPVALNDHPPPGGWTTDDLDALPEDGYRRELLDGVLLASPSPTEIYVPTGEWSDAVTAVEPWKIHIPIARITPRFYRPAG